MEQSKEGWDWKGPNEGKPEAEKMAFMVGLTFEDMLHLKNGGIININPKSLGLVDLPIHIFLGGTEEHMKNGVAKHPGVVHQSIDTHEDRKN